MRGFTLVELLIVIAIIAVLSVIGVATYSGLQLKARDSARKSDVGAITSAMEANYGKTTANQYSALLNSFFASGVAPVDPRDGNATGCSGNPCKYCFRQHASTVQTAGNCASGDEVVGEGVGPDGGATSLWIVCANLESNSGLGGVNYHCKGNQQ